MRYLVLALLLAGCGGGSAEGPPGTAWTQQPDIHGVCCNHAAIVSTDSGLRIFTNSTGAVDGDLVLDGRSVLHIAEPRDGFIRTVAVTRTADGYAALLYTGDGYPTMGGYSPSFATSPDGIAWTWRGPISPYGRNQSSGQALVIDGATYRAWIDIAGELREMHSDGGAWVDGGAIGFSGLYVSAAKTPTGTMLAFADSYPATRITTLWKCDGGEWAVLEADAPIRNGDKGTALAYGNGAIHAYANGRHWTRSEPSCP